MKKFFVIFLISALLFAQAVFAEEENAEEGIHVMFAAITIIFGVVALVWTNAARKKLGEGSSLKQYITNFLIALIFILGANIWHFLREVTAIGTKLGMYAEYPEYLLYILAYLVFVLAAYQMNFISQEFSFEDQAADMKKALEGKKKI